MKNSQSEYLLKPADIEKNARMLGMAVSDLDVSPTSILTFNKPVVEYLDEWCGLREQSLSNNELCAYAAAPRSWKGAFAGHSVSVFIPPMGASPIAAFCEELIHFGSSRIYLVCASWSLGEKHLGKGQIHLPNVAVGMDGTTYHYGNVNYRVEAESDTQSALRDALSELGADWKEGGVGCCEAFYRITREMVCSFRDQGCLSMDNGEVAVLYSLAREKGIKVGVLLQPYIDLEKGFDIFYLDETYRETCRMQVRAVLRVIQGS